MRGSEVEWLQDITLQDIITAGAIVVAILLGLNQLLLRLKQLRWATEYKAAKDEIIRAKDVQRASLEQEIASLKERSPPEIEKYALSVQRQLEVIVDKTKAEVDKTQAELETKSRLDDELFHSLAESVAHLMSELDPPVQILKAVPLTALILVRDMLYFVAQESQPERQRALGRLCLRVIDAFEAQAAETDQVLALKHYVAKIRPPHSKFFEILPDILDQDTVRRNLKVDDEATEA